MIPGITDTKKNLDAIKKLTEGYEFEYIPEYIGRIIKLVIEEGPI